MTITATVQDGQIKLPSGFRLPNGTRVEIVVVSGEDAAKHAGPVSLPTFRGDGLQSGVDLDDMRAVRQILDADNKLPQLP